MTIIKDLQLYEAASFICFKEKLTFSLVLCSLICNFARDYKYKDYELL